jgi:hypothetical protein
MKGNNTITLCPAEMQRAIQHYFHTVLFRPKSCPEVQSVSQSSGIEKSFVIEVKEDPNRKYG